MRFLELQTPRYDYTNTLAAEYAYAAAPRKRTAGVLRGLLPQLVPLLLIVSSWVDDADDPDVRSVAELFGPLSWGAAHAVAGLDGAGRVARPLHRARSRMGRHHHHAATRGRASVSRRPDRPEPHAATAGRPALSRNT